MIVPIGVLYAFVMSSGLSFLGKVFFTYVRVMTGPLPFSRKHYSEYRSLRCSRCMLQVDEVTVKYLDYDNGAMDRRVPIWDVPVD